MTFIAIMCRSIVLLQEHTIYRRAHRNMHTLKALTMTPFTPVGKLSSPRYNFGKIATSCFEPLCYMLSH